MPGSGSTTHGDQLPGLWANVIRNGHGLVAAEFQHEDDDLAGHGLLAAACRFQPVSEYFSFYRTQMAALPRGSCRVAGLEFIQQGIGHGAIETRRD